MEKIMKGALMIVLGVVCMFCLFCEVEEGSSWLLRMVAIKAVGFGAGWLIARLGSRREVEA